MTPPETKIVALDDLKAAFGIDAEDTSLDATLAVQEAAAAAWVEGETGRRFQAPVERIEYVEGSGTRTLYLDGHVDLPTPDDPEEDPPILVRSRPVGVSGDWTDDDGFERRRDTLIRTDGACWWPSLEYEVTYDDGYEAAPDDIQALVIELVGVSRTKADGTAGLTSETVGDYSYTKAAQIAVAEAIVSDTGTATLDRWRRGRI